ncbi:MAG: hemolysin III family protein [Deltaproteobacteria bacterium]|nr:hemolysin III family protein [Deltaproteobacteria bacterium]
MINVLIKIHRSLHIVNCTVVRDASLKPARTLSKDGSHHVTDEIYNTLISSLGAVLSIVGVILLLSSSITTHKPWHIFSVAVYGVALINLFVASALHHGVSGSARTEHLLRQWDYYAIFIMIAGTFTPICLILLRNTLGWSTLGLIWFLAVLGIVLKTKFHHLPKWIWVGLYIGMGWLALPLVGPLYREIPGGFVLLMIGGLFFTIGALFYYLEKPNPFPGKFGFHEIWHLFVLAGGVSHFCVIYFYLLPI